jgi:hypothetical protein
MKFIDFCLFFVDFDNCSDFVKCCCTGGAEKGCRRGAEGVQKGCSRVAEGF